MFIFICWQFEYNDHINNSSRKQLKLRGEFKINLIVVYMYLPVEDI